MCEKLEFNLPVFYNTARSLRSYRIVISFKTNFYKLLLIQPTVNSPQSANVQCIPLPLNDRAVVCTDTYMIYSNCILTKRQSMIGI